MKKAALFFVFTGILVGILWLPFRLSALTETPSRQSLEKNYFSEMLINFSLYAKSTHDVFNVQERKFVHGLDRLLIPYIYEPDVYTWDLARGVFRKQREAMAPPVAPIAAPGLLQPMATPMGGIVPVPVQLTPLTPPGPSFDAGHVENIKQGMVSHMNALNSRAENQPTVPVLPNKLPKKMPKGKRGDSCDSTF
ncbi:MAG: hypothetical protein HQM08_12350 [Candidatus Riflebacteria bacterium]|nr:hypothetical protein [Candidatus Riflebacteria bacterium]